MTLRRTFRINTLRATTLVLTLVFATHAVQAFVGKHRVKKDEKHLIEQLETQWRDAQLTGNVPEMSKLLSEDYFGISMTGQVNTKAQQLERMSNRSLVLTRIDLSDLKIKLIGPTAAIVTSRAEIEGTADGSSMAGSFRYTRVYQRTPAGNWQITNFEATRLQDPRNHPFGPPHPNSRPHSASPSSSPASPAESSSPQ